MRLDSEFEDLSSSSTGSSDNNNVFHFESDDGDKKISEIVNFDEQDAQNTGLEAEENMSLNSFSKHQHTRLPKKIRRAITAFNVLLSILLAVSVFATGIFGFVIYISEGARYVEITDDHDDLGINTEAVSKLPKGITNIALFGIDSRSKVTDNKSKAISGRSDSMIILSINTNDKTVKITSILRDSWVYIDGKRFNGYNKINSAYAYGGAELAIKTLNQNFGLNITDYVSVSLYQLWKVIDFMGGVDIKITEAERKELNRLAVLEGFNVTKIEKAGEVHLDGGQAMIYSRIRKIDGENIRALRQQKVLNCLLQKAKAMSATEYPSLLRSVLANVETSLSYDEILSFAPMLAESSLQLQSTSIPGNEVVGRGGVFEDTRGGWVWKYDMEDAKKYIYKWIYGIE